ncbi:hypothetical protein BC827DRAFT_328887 [Russula dissimulans]|nr:hypothetical protein BC827DRAFT_328887 [Russula dissimulans]
MSIPVVSSRTDGQVVLHLDPKRPAPTLPYELHKYVSADAWAVRIPQLVRLTSRYNRPVLEGIWFITMFIMTLAVPAVLHAIILRSFKQTLTHDDARREARFIAIVIAIAIMLLFTGPHIVWKFMGQKRATELVKRWESEDARLRSPGEFVPVWTVHLPGYLSTSTVRRWLFGLQAPLSRVTHASTQRLVITTPYAPTSSTFHPAAYRPSWVNGAADSGQPNTMPPTYQRYQQQAMYGQVPLYGNPSSSLPAYVGDGARGYADDKARPSR